MRIPARCERNAQLKNVQTIETLFADYSLFSTLIFQLLLTVSKKNISVSETYLYEQESSNKRFVVFRLLTGIPNCFEKF